MLKEELNDGSDKIIQHNSTERFMPVIFMSKILENFTVLVETAKVDIKINVMLNYLMLYQIMLKL